jgi:hypothetical protein
MPSIVPRSYEEIAGTEKLTTGNAKSGGMHARDEGEHSMSVTATDVLDYERLMCEARRDTICCLGCACRGSFVDVFRPRDFHVVATTTNADSRKSKAP